MLSPKRISLLLAVTFVASLVVIIATTLSRGQTTPASNPGVTVLRHKGQRNLPPTAAEIAAFQKGQRERTLKTREFKDMPLAVREVRNLQSDTWHKDLEIEVKNVSAKPIYFMLVYLVFPDWPPPANGRVGVPIPFGERKYIDFNTIADPRDPHLNPGETFIFRIPEKLQKGLRVKHERDPEVMKRLEFDISTVSFGDGTGIVAQRLRDWRIKKAHYDAKKHHASGFKDSGSVRSPPQDGCGPCARYKLDPLPYHICYGINPQTGKPDTCDSTLAIDSADQPCTKVGSTFFDCDNDGYPECRDDFIYDSPDYPGFVPTPTPSPSPSPSPEQSPSPSPSPTCDPSQRPNPSNCSCEDNGHGGVDWVCGCPDGSDGADYIHILTNYGCAPNKYNVNDCCECIDQNQTCPSGCHWDTSRCECVDFLGAPCSAATPIPNPNPPPSGGGRDGGGGGYSCTEYDWVLYYYLGGRWVEVARWYAGCF